MTTEMAAPFAFGVFNKTESTHYIEHGVYLFPDSESEHPVPVKEAIALIRDISRSVIDATDEGKGEQDESRADITRKLGELLAALSKRSRELSMAGPGGGFMHSPTTHEEFVARILKAMSSDRNYLLEFLPKPARQFTNDDLPRKD